LIKPSLKSYLKMLKTIFYLFLNKPTSTL